MDLKLKVLTTSIAVALLSVTSVFAAGDATAGKALYDKSCKNCHGANGVANPNIAKMMKVEIPALGSAQVQKMSDAEIESVITKGKGKMPAIHTLTEKQAADIVAYIRTLKS
jgi:mono/diheme cytochrome c family protein